MTRILMPGTVLSGGRVSERLVWLDWGRHLRTRSLCRRLDAELVEICPGGSRVLRYARSMVATVRFLRRRRPATVIATNPSIVLGFFLLVLRGYFGFKLVSDAHYAGVQAFMGHRLLQRFLDYHNRKADLVIVTNQNQAERLEGIGARVYVCPDPLPDLDPTPMSLAIVPDKSVLLICSFDIDEPYGAAFEAFSSLNNEGYSVYVSGNYRSANIDIAQYPGITFLGFVQEAVYNDYLRSCSVIVDLTDYEDCLVCGAYEAMALHKPLVLSGTKALGEYFGQACILTENTSAAISASVRLAYEQRSELTARARNWVEQNKLYMNDRVRGFRAVMGAIESGR